MINNFEKELNELINDYNEKIKPIKDMQLQNCEEIKNLCNKYLNENDVNRRITKVEPGLNCVYLTSIDTTPYIEEVK